MSSTSTRRSKRPDLRQSKGTLLRVLSEIGNYRGIDIKRTPGEHAAILIAAKVLERAKLEEIDLAAEIVASSHPDLKCFWGKQWQ